VTCAPFSASKLTAEAVVGTTTPLGVSMAAQVKVPGLATRLLALRLLQRIDEEGAWLSRILGVEAERSGLNASDKSLLLNICQTVLRRRPALLYVIRGCARQGKVPDEVAQILEVAMVQMLFMDRIPDHAAVDLAVRSARRAGLNKATGLINGILRRVGREKADWAKRFEREQKGALMGPAPAQLYGRWCQRMGVPKAAALQRALGRPATVEARIDKETCEHWCELIGATPIEGMATHMLLPPGAPDKLKGFSDGAWSVQDRNAARIVPLLPLGGSKVADLCAAPGGKTVQLAQRFPKSELVAIDLHEHRAGLLRQALERCGCSARVEVGDAVELCPQLGPFDRIVLDAPCSGLGTLRRHPEIAGRSRLAALSDNAALQARLLSAAIDALSPGGVLIYSVCSLEPQEGELVIEQALRSGLVQLVDGPDLPGGQGCFGLDGEGDGFFVARLEKI
jgi:16S rRNA (cytosine967-C5)-methyltransferase